MKTGGKLVAVAGLVAILGGFGYLLYSGIGENLVYFLTPTELVAKGAAAHDAPVRLGGQVAPGSVDWDPATLQLKFVVTDGKQTLPVHSEGAPPAMFRDGIGVIVEGRITQAGVFESNSVMVKHSNEYRPPHEGQKPEEIYKSLIVEEGT